MAKKIEKGNYGCLVCPKLFSSAEKQVEHWKAEHSGKKKFEENENFKRCEYCGEKFRTGEGLDHHYQKNHQGIIELKT